MSKVNIYQYELLENFLSANFLANIDVILVGWHSFFSHVTWSWIDLFSLQLLMYLLSYINVLQGLILKWWLYSGILVCVVCLIFVFQTGLGNDHLTWREGLWFFSKKIFCFPMLLKKIFWFWWRNKKKIWFRIFVI